MQKVPPHLTAQQYARQRPSLRSNGQDRRIACLFEELIAQGCHAPSQHERYMLARTRGNRAPHHGFKRPSEATDMRREVRSIARDIAAIKAAVACAIEQHRAFR